MTSFETFEATLKEVVQAKRLSASKMTKITEIALSSMQDDTQLVSILYRTHKSLAPSQKISSLYVFDALVRAARNQIVKHGITTPPNSSGHGNAATFLSKIEGVVDSLFEDMVSTGNAEAKEKTRKILDIWVKSNALPSGVLKRLGDLIKDTRAEAKGKEPPEKINPTDPRNHLSPPSATPPFTSNIVNPAPQGPTVSAGIPISSSVGTAAAGTSTDALQSTLLALLNQAANTASSAGNGQTGTNTASVAGASLVNTAGLDVNQLALLQQLTQTAKSGGLPSGGNISINTAVQNVPQSLIVGVGDRNGDSFAGPSSTTHQSQLLPYREDPSRARYGAPRHSTGRFQGDEFHDDRRGDRGFARGGRGRGRGRWGEGEDRHHSWDHRSPRDKGEWGSRSPQASQPQPLMSRRYNGSRSRSPSRNKVGGNSGRRPYSPPQRSVVKDADKAGNGATTNTEQDEFGRDIRPMSVDGDSEPAIVAGSFSGQNMSKMAHETPTGTVGAPSQTHEESKPISGGASTKAANPNLIGAPTAPIQSLPIATYESRDVTGGGGLQSFDFTNFEFTSPASWEALGKAWHVTNGYSPSQEELLQFVMVSTGVASMAGGVGGRGAEGVLGNKQGEGGQWQTEKGINSQDRNPGHGKVEDTAYGTSIDTWEVTAKEANIREASQNQDSSEVTDRSVGSSGKMQRVGDKWVFVRS